MANKSLIDMEYETRANEDYDADDFEDSWTGKLKRELIPSIEAAQDNIAYALGAGDLPSGSRTNLVRAYLMLSDTKENVLEVRHPNH